MCSQISHEFPPVDVETCIMMLLVKFRAKTKSAKCLRSPLLATLGPLFLMWHPRKKKQLEKRSLSIPRQSQLMPGELVPPVARACSGVPEGKSKMRNQAGKLWKNLALLGFFAFLYSSAESGNASATQSSPHSYQGSSQCPELPLPFIAREGKASRKVLLSPHLAHLYLIPLKASTHF